ncbi:MAG: hypothetical protein AB9900_03225 [Humidesulfovibrio sp.]
MEDRIKELMNYCRADGRVCPNPSEWNALYTLLPNRRCKGGGWEPAVPLILAAWWDTSALAKMVRLEEHIRWAAEHSALDAVESFLRGLPENKWHHAGD